MRGGLLEPVGVAVLGGQSVPDFGNGLAGRTSILLDLEAIVGMAFGHGVANERGGGEVGHKGHGYTALQEDGGQSHTKNKGSVLHEGNSYTTWDVGDGQI